MNNTFSVLTFILVEIVVYHVLTIILILSLWCVGKIVNTKSNENVFWLYKKNIINLIN